MARKKVKSDPILTQIADGMTETAKRATGSLALALNFEPDHMREGEILYFDPTKDPINFLKKPFGTSVREEMRYHLTKIAGHLAWVYLTTEKYPWMIAEEDRKILDQLWSKIHGMHIHNKNDKNQ